VKINVRQLFSNNSSVVVNVGIESSLEETLSEACRDLSSSLDDESPACGVYCTTLVEAHKVIMNELNVFGDLSKDIIMPPVGVGTKDEFKQKVFSTAMLDFLTFIKLSGIECELGSGFVNVTLNGKKCYGLFFFKGPQRTLKNNFIRTLRELKKRIKSVDLPSKVCCMIMNSTNDVKLSAQKIDKIVPDIFSGEEIIKPVKKIEFRCIAPTCTILEDLDDEGMISEYLLEHLG